MGEGDVGQAGQSRRAAMGAVHGREGRRLGGSLKGVIFSFGQSGQTPRGSEENSGGGLDVGRRGGAGCPHVQERAAQGVFIELGKSRLYLHGGGQKSGEN